MKPYIHARSTVKRYGGKVEDFLPIHDFMDSTKSAHASVKHRAIFHSAFGAFVVEKVFGHLTKFWKKELPPEVQLEVLNLKSQIENLQKQIDQLEEPYVGHVSTRDIAEQHIIEDLGLLPSLDDYLSAMEIQEWMGGKKKEKTEHMKLDFIPIVNPIVPTLNKFDIID